MPKVVYTYAGGFHLSAAAVDWLSERGFPFDVAGADDLGARSSPLRSHPLLAVCVEALGEKANGRYCQLAIAEVVDLYRIEEFDGQEVVCTPETDQWRNARAERDAHLALMRKRVERTPGPIRVGDRVACNVPRPAGPDRFYGTVTDLSEGRVVVKPDRGTFNASIAICHPEHVSLLVPLETP